MELLDRAHVHEDATLFHGSGGYMLMSVSYRNLRSVGVSGGTLRWLSIRSAARVTDAPVGMCMEDSVLHNRLDRPAAKSVMTPSRLPSWLSGAILRQDEIFYWG